MCFDHNVSIPGKQMNKKCAKIDCYEPAVRQVITTNKQGVRIAVWFCIRHHEQAAAQSYRIPDNLEKVEW